MLDSDTLAALTSSAKPYKRADANGLYIEVRPNGAKWWRFRYTYAGREKLLSMGTFPDTGLEAAREHCEAAQALLKAGRDPSEERRSERAARLAAEAARCTRFRSIAEEWLEKRAVALKPGTVRQLERRLCVYVYPSIGHRVIGEISAPEIVAMLRQIEASGIHETTRRVRSLCSRVFRYAIAIGFAERDPAADTVAALAPRPRTKHFAALTAPQRIGELMRAIHGYQGQPAVMAALKLAPLVFVRPGELRRCAWSEIDVYEREWRIPAHKMKMNREHIVPLSTQALDILEQLRSVTGATPLVFPSTRSWQRPISDNTLNAALRRLGFSTDEMTAHGFRTMASTRLNELGYPPHIIELQLAHVDRNSVRDAYNRAEFLGERRAMMQAWADHLDELRARPHTTTAARATAPDKRW